MCFCPVDVFNMKTNQYKIAEWLGTKAPTLANVFNGRRGISKATASKWAEISGLSFEELMLSDGKQLRKKVSVAFAMANENIGNSRGQR